LPTPQCKFFAWLILQDRVWNCDRLERWGWDHSPTCPLCRQTMETAHHLLADCRFTCRIWNEIANLIRLPELQLTNWPPSENPIEWWVIISSRQKIFRKASRSITLLIIGKFGKRETFGSSTALSPCSYTCNLILKKSSRSGSRWEPSVWRPWMRIYKVLLVFPVRRLYFSSISMK
jgi:hypothetical protein